MPKAIKAKKAPRGEGREAPGRHQRSEAGKAFVAATKRG
jgi:hypothetical protein